MLGGEQQECPFQSLRAGILEQCLELLLYLLLGWMLSCSHSVLSPAFPLDEAPWSSPDNPKRLVYMVGSRLQ